MKLSQDLVWRGLIKDKTFADTSWLDKPQTFYHGVDASSDSMTIGNLAAMLLARRLIDGGWKAVILAGGATSLIGDPGGKTAERELKPREEIQKNVEAIKAQINKLFADKEFTLVDNYDWFKDIGYLEFLREVGKHYSMTELMQREFVNGRMGKDGSGISYAEFSYSLVQGYDYWYLYKKYKTVLQTGGSDQWGNMLSGVPLIRKKENAEVHALSMPLVVNKATGTKFGKSEGGAIWLDPAKTSPIQFYQFWINVDDTDIEDYLKVFTLLPKNKIEQVVAQHNNDPSKRIAQIVLAEEVTKLVHGENQSSSATGVTKYLTGQVSLADASEADRDLLRQELQGRHYSAKFGDSIIQALVSIQLASSNTEARGLLDNGAVYINGKSVSRLQFIEEDSINGLALMRRGKEYRNSALIQF